MHPTLQMLSKCESLMTCRIEPKKCRMKRVDKVMAMTTKRVPLYWSREANKAAVSSKKLKKFVNEAMEISTPSVQKKANLGANLGEDVTSPNITRRGHIPS